jgi:tape measure domain-containing protein
MDLGTMVVNFEANLSQLTSGVAQAKSDISSVGDAAQSTGEQTSGGFLGAIGSVVSFGAKMGQTLIGVKALADGAVNLASGLLQPAESAETVQTAFTTLLGSTSAANNELQKLDAFASKTPFQTMDIDQAAAQLIGFGANAADVIPDLTAIGDALSAVGRGSAANLDSVVNIFGKIQTEGKLTVGTMQELSTNGINAWAVLEQQTGKTRDQLQTMISSGLFPAKDAIDDLTKGIEKNPLYTGGMAKQSNTLTGILSTLKSNWDQMMVSFGTPIIKELEGGLADVGTMLTSPAFKDFAGGIGQGIATVFTDISKGVQYVSEVLGTVNLSDFEQALHAVGTAAIQVERGFDTLRQAIAPVQGDFDPIAEVMQRLAQGGLNVVSGLLWDISEAFVAVDRAVQTGQGPLGGLVTFFNTEIKPALVAVLPDFEHLGDVLLNTVAPAIEHLISGRLSTMVDIFKDFAPIAEDILPPLIRFGGWLVNELADGLQFAMPYIVQVTDAINQFASDIAERVVRELELDFCGTQRRLGHHFRCRQSGLVAGFWHYQDWVGHFGGQLETSLD